MGDVYVRVIPPPPPTLLAQAGAATAIIAAIVAFLGYSLAAGIFATISAAADITYLVLINGRYWVPKEALDSEGRLKTEDTQARKNEQL